MSKTRPLAIIRNNEREIATASVAREERKEAAEGERIKEEKKNELIGEREPSSNTAKVFNFYKETRAGVQLIFSTIF